MCQDLEVLNNISHLGNLVFLRGWCSNSGATKSESEEVRGSGFHPEGHGR